MPAHMASIHLRSMTRATPSRMASTSSRPHSLPSQMARCKHQSHSLIDIPRPEREGLADPPCSNTQSFAHRAYRDGHRQVSTGTALTATNARTPTLRPHRPPVEDAPSGSRAPPLGSVLSPSDASSRLVRPRGSIGQGRHLRTRASVRAATPAHVRSSVVRPSAYAPGEVPTPTHQAAPPPSFLRSPRVGSLAPLRLPAPGGTSGPCWAASAGSLKAHRRPPGRPPWGSWTLHPTYGVCVTTPLPRCLNGVRDH